MDPVYQPFSSNDNNSVRSEQMTTAEKGMKRIVVYLFYGILVVLLLVVLMVTGIKFSQLNKEMTDIKIHLERISQIIRSGGTSPHDVNLQKRNPVQGSCREGWVSFKTSCYLLSTNALTWHAAEEQCRTHGAHLLVLNNVEELDYISEVSDISFSYWIGLVERAHEGHWSWVDGMDFNSTPTYWDEGQPDDWDYRENGEDCGQLHSSEKRKRRLWNDADCKLPYKFICEKVV